MHRVPSRRRPWRGPAVLAAAALVLAGGITAFVLVRQVTADSPASAQPQVSSTLTTLLREGTLATASGYWEDPSAALEAAASGEDDARFRALGALLVKDGYASVIIDLGREMTGGWYNWSEEKCPRAEPDCYIQAWRQAVDAMRSVPGQHFRFLWTVFPGTAAAIDAWPGSAYVDMVGTDIYDWYGGPSNTYPHTASGQLDHNAKWQQILTQPGGLDWIARLSQLTGKPIAIPEWGLDFHSFGGQDDPAFITRMVAWLHTNHAIGIYWAVDHVATDQAAPAGPLLTGLGAYAGTPAGVNGFGQLLGGRLQYAEAFLPDSQAVSDSTAQPVLATWQNAGYQIILSVPLVPLTVPSYNGPPEPAGHPYQLADYPDAVAAFRQAISATNGS
jgi:Glycosyl hydrolase family 26